MIAVDAPVLVELLADGPRADAVETSLRQCLGGGRVVMLSEYVSISVLQTLRWGLAAALSVVLLIATLALLWIVSKVIGVRRLMGSA